ncbi:MAG: deoxyribose-phosphate aldolase [Clostridiales bacterium]|mgnify:FL=1|nr:deoxyribose-phosphate aldolase [Bacillota bacterium]MEE0517841.1 deoxyribose-phosphate aldolase [Anaerovoracaceae bacterium]PWL92934.1 MAG: deoxyribose-phosphate aldolase [Clostridiales bacterium]
MKLSKPLNKYFDHTLLKADATTEQIDLLCSEALKYDFYSVCVNSCNVAQCKDALEGSDVKIAAVVGFPLGACTTATKVFETEEACRDGASEIDMVINIGALKEGGEEFVYEDIKAVVDAAAKYDAIVKVIIETCLLTDEQKETACRLSEEAKAAFVKTSTGFSTGGATEDDVALMRKIVGERLSVKASGGIRNYDTVMAMIAAGADRIGASASVAVMEDSKKRQ